MTKTLILSDLHLGAANAQVDAQLAALHSDFDRLIVNGDTVDHYDFRRFSEGHWAVLNRLRAVAHERELVLVRGNHDWRLPFSADPNASYRLLEHYVGARMRDRHDLQVGRRKYLVLHGDQFDKTMNLTRVGEVADFFYRRVQQVSHGAARWLKAASKLVCGVVEQVKQKACRHAKELGYQGVVVGHTHFRCDEEVDGIHYLNTGCWVEAPCSYVLLEGSDLALRNWTQADSTPELILPRPRPIFEPALLACAE